MPITPFVETFERLGIAADIGMPTLAILVAPIPALPSAPVSVVPIVLLSTIPTAPIPASRSKFPFPFTFSFIFLCESVLSRSQLLILPCAFLIGPLSTALSQFEVGSSSVTIPNLANEAAAFFARFDQPEVNDLGPVDYWASGPSYVDFCKVEFNQPCVGFIS